MLLWSSRLIFVIILGKNRRSNYGGDDDYVNDDDNDDDNDNPKRLGEPLNSVDSYGVKIRCPNFFTSDVSGLKHMS